MESMLQPETLRSAVAQPGRVRPLERRQAQSLAARERARRLADGLVGRTIPALRLTTAAGALVDLRSEAERAAVFYLYPGVAASPDGVSDTAVADAALHRAFDRHYHDLRARSLNVLGLSSEPEHAQLVRLIEHRVGHELVSDPELRLAHTLGLPTFTDDAVECYRRLTLVAFAGRIAKAFYPIDSPERSAAQVVWWLRVTGR